jgi:hypothetical protein
MDMQFIRFLTKKKKLFRIVARAVIYLIIKQLGEIFQNTPAILIAFFCLLCVFFYSSQ